VKVAITAIVTGIAVAQKIQNFWETMKPESSGLPEKKGDMLKIV